MRIIATPDGTINRYDRALWQTPPFDLLLWIIIVPDCRLYSVPFEDRTYAVPLEDRAFAVQLEDRTYAVSVEDRTYAVPLEDRTYEVKCG